MAGATVVMCCVFLCWTSCTAAQRLDLEEGKVCKEVDGVNWSCKFLKDCPTAQEGLRKRGQSPQICSFSGNDSIVCCSPGKDPSTSPPPANTQPLSSPLPSTTTPPLSSPPTSPTGIKSKQMCQKYADAVYIRIPDLMTDDEISYDTCAWREENTTRVKRIVDGSYSLGREFPHMAQIGFQKGEEEITWLCGGSLISERFVLSSAVCVGAKNIGTAKWARVGDYNIKTDADEEMVLAQPTTYRITEIITHPEYPGRRYTNNIALFKMNDSVIFTEFIRPICLQTEHDFPDTHAVATGWGKTDFGGVESDVLLKVNLSISSAKQCNEAFGEIISKRESFAGNIDASIICAGGDLGKDTCQGDSGGPLQVRLKQPYCMYSQVGITSFGRACGSGYPGAYNRVSHFVPWIESIVWP